MIVIHFGFLMCTHNCTVHYFYLSEVVFREYYSISMSTPRFNNYTQKYLIINIILNYLITEARKLFLTNLT